MDTSKIKSLTAAIGHDLRELQALCRDADAQSVVIVQPPVDLLPLLRELAVARAEKEACTYRWLDKPRDPDAGGYVNEQHRDEWSAVHKRYHRAVEKIAEYAGALVAGATLVPSTDVEAAGEVAAAAQ